MEDKCLEATLRLHEEFPDAPTNVRTARLESVDGAIRAGSTSVALQTRKAALAVQKLVGVKVLFKSGCLMNWKTQLTRECQMRL